MCKLYKSVIGRRNDEGSVTQQILRFTQDDNFKTTTSCQ
jgi:hypothetical protein